MARIILIPVTNREQRILKTDRTALFGQEANSRQKYRHRRKTQLVPIDLVKTDEGAERTAWLPTFLGFRAHPRSVHHPDQTPYS